MRKRLFSFRPDFHRPYFYELSKWDLRWCLFTHERAGAGDNSGIWKKRKASENPGELFGVWKIGIPEIPI